MKTFRQFYEEMMVANAPGTSGGFGQKSDAAGPTAGCCLLYTSDAADE